MIRVFIACFSLLSFFTIASTQFTYDGHYDKDDYDVNFDIDYEWDGTWITGGKIAFAEHDNQQYMYIAHPLGFVDLSYGTHVDQKFRVGWGGQDKGGKLLEKAYDSEKMNFIFDKSILTADENSDLKIKLDSRGNSTSGPRTSESGHSATFLTTLDYNHSIVGSEWTSKDFHLKSPKTKSPGNIPNCLNETSSDPSCYALATGNRNRDSEGNLYDWDFNYGVEIKLGSGFFSDINALLPTMFAYNTVGALINLKSLHASDPKITGTSDHGNKPCVSDGSTPHHDPCGTRVTSPPHQEVPEPSTLVMFALALGLLRIQSKRRNT